MKWSILYRGPLSSCNYGCDYCPFAKTRNTRDELLDDAFRLDRFVKWVRSRSEQIGVLFTPWGEALIHPSYQRALVSLSHGDNVWKVAIQTNLSCRLDWLGECDLRRLALWTTWHPTQVSLERFVSQCGKLDASGVRYSVGIVGKREVIPSIKALRAAIAPHIYVWVNAWKREAQYYNESDITEIERVDPYFRINTIRHSSMGRACRAGHTLFTVDGEGDIRRCHFIKDVLGNIYESGFEKALEPRRCTVETCGCHIGYVHLEPLDLYATFGDGVLERIPDGWPSGKSQRNKLDPATT
jgi:MoaA/NifB/PqqE/SkfB family radical SAM enzyme